MSCHFGRPDAKLGPLRPTSRSLRRHRGPVQRWFWLTTTLHATPWTRKWMEKYSLDEEGLSISTGRTKTLGFNYGPDLREICVVVVILVVSLDALQMESAPESDTNHQVRSSRALGWTDVDGWRAGGVGGVSGGGGGGKADREGGRAERRVAHLKLPPKTRRRRRKGRRAGAAGRTPDNASGQKHGGDERRTTALVVVSVVF